MSTSATYKNWTLESTTPSARLKYEISPRWVRVEFNQEFVAGSKDVLLVWDGGFSPVYYFPQEDIRSDVLKLGRKGSNGRQYYDLQVGDRLAEASVWTYPDPAPEREFLEGYLSFKWNKMDRWFEEEEEVFVHPRDPYHRVDVVPSSRHIRVEIDGQTLADTRRPLLLFETNLPTRYYIPQEDIRMDLLVPARARSTCPYKGDATYWSVIIGDKTYCNFVWGYLDPLPESPRIMGLLSFFNEKLNIYVDGQLEEKPKTLWS